MLAHGLRRFAQGIYILWYPLKAEDGGDGPCGRNVD